MIGVLLLLLASEPIEKAKPAVSPRDGASTILTMKRVFVDIFGGGDGAVQMRDKVIASLQSAGVIQVTENEERADVVLRGSGDDEIFNDLHQISDNISAHLNASAGATSKSYSSNGASIGQNESSHISERQHEASAAVRLVNKDGDVIWSTTQESRGAKFRGASADVAERITRKLLDDIERARKATPVHK